ncbi:MAG: hypothetical protein Q7S87_08925 [Agitococcus sp.]|nr:hypothetical protein [Agitococcus sp.]MDO9177023.1 hypothetical protein [Agitococcus sp.]
MPKKNKEAATVAPVVKKQTEGDTGSGDFLSSSVKRAEPSAEAILGDSGTPPLKSAPHSGFKPLVAKAVGSPVESPSIVMTTEDKAWVRLDAQSTQIFKKGQVVPGLGVFLGADKKSAKFDTGSVPLSAE